MSNGGKRGQVCLARNFSCGSAGKLFFSPSFRASVIYLSRGRGELRRCVGPNSTRGMEVLNCPHASILINNGCGLPRRFSTRVSGCSGLFI